MEKDYTKKIVVDAYFMNNLGDDLFLDTLISRYPNVKFSFLTPNLTYIKYFANNPQIEIINNRSLIKKINEFDSYITIGGSMFQQPKGWLKLWFIFSFKIFLFRIKNKRTYLIGCNFGPVKSKIYLFLYNSIFKFVDYISVRDKASSDLLTTKAGNVHLHPDIVFSLDKKYRINVEKKYIGISLMDFGGKPFDREYQLFMIKIINNLAENNKIRIFSFQDTEHISDMRIINSIIKKVNTENIQNIEIVNYQGDIQDTLNKLNECRSFLATRFHSMILSIIFSIPVIALNYNEKVKNTIDSLKLQAYYINMENLHDKIGQVQDFLINAENHTDNINLKKMIALYNEALKHFEELDYYVM